jgi:dCMP deaminase
MNEFYTRGMNAALRAAAESDDPDTKIGCAIFEPGAFNPFSTDANRLPRGIEKTVERTTRPEKYNWIEHAERNAIYGHTSHDLSGCVVFLNWFPCADCSRALVAVGISELVYIYIYHQSETLVRPTLWI